MKVAFLYLSLPILSPCPTEEQSFLTLFMVLFFSKQYDLMAFLDVLTLVIFY